MTISKKLYLGYAAALLITIVIGSASIRNLGVLGDQMTDIGTIKTRQLYLTGDVDNLTSDILGATRGVNLNAHRNNMESVRKDFEQIQSETERTRKEASEFAANATSADLKDQMQTKVLDKLPTYLQLASEDEELVSKGNLAAADALFFDKLYPLMNDISSAADDINQGESKVVNEYAATAVSAVAPARNMSIALVLLALAVGGVVLWIVKGINDVLQGSIAELTDGANQVASAAQQVSSTSQTLAQGASEQAASLEETSASSEEVNSMARKNSDNSRATATLLSASQMKVEQADRYLQEMVVSMDQITESSGKISKIIKVIDEIAFQTNILALNAAVEAARAGEAGMGFAVVADEVRSLAQRCAQAAKDTASLIEDSITRSNEGKAKVDQVAVAIRAVTEDSTKVKVMVDEVSLGSEEQSRGIEQIGRAIVQIEQITRNNAAGSEESAAAAEELSAQSESLREVLNRLQEMVGGGGHEGMPAMRASIRPSTKPAAFKMAPSKLRPSAPASRQPSTNGMKKAAMNQDFPLEESFQSF